MHPFDKKVQIYNEFIRKDRSIPKQQIEKVQVGPQAIQSDSSSEEDNIDVQKLMEKEAQRRQQSYVPQKKVKVDSNDNEDQPTEFAQNGEQPQNDSTDVEQHTDENLTEKYRAMGLPITCEAFLEGHSRPISSITIQKNGVRMATGSWDTDVRLWDFYGMNKSMNSFRILTPIENHVVQNISYNADEQEILVVSASAQPKIISHEGKDLVECMKGDQYLIDKKNTRGHTAMCYDGTYHPTEKNKFLTCSQDGTMRLWDRFKQLWGLEQKQQNSEIIICNQQGKKIQVFSCNYMRDGKMAVGCCSDGTIKCYDLKGYYGRANIQFDKTHQPEALVTKCLPFSDGFRILTRAQDNTMKLWDARYNKSVVKTWSNLENNHAGCKMDLSPDEKYIITGTSYERTKDISGTMKIFDASTFEEKVSLNTGENGVVDMKWHAQLNQIFLGLSGGQVMALFDPILSKKGVVSCLAKKEREYAPIEFSNAMIIKTPHALPIFRDAPINKKKTYEKIRQDSQLSKEPLKPPPIKSSGGRAGGAYTVTQNLMQNLHKNEYIFEDSQQALTKLQSLTEKGPQLVNAAYKKTQPETIFDRETPDHEESKLLSSLTVICPKCGLKLCTCKTDPVYRK